MRPSERHIFGSKDWQDDQRHKRLRPSGIAGRRIIYSSRAHDKAMLAEWEAELELEKKAYQDLIEYELFNWALSTVALGRPDFETIQTTYRLAHPRAKVNL